MRIYLTPEWNIKDNTLKNNNILFVKDYDWEDIVPCRFKDIGLNVDVLVKNISLYEHYLVVLGLNMVLASAHSSNNMEEYKGEILPLYSFINKYINKNKRRIEIASGLRR